MIININVNKLLRLKYKPNASGVINGITWSLKRKESLYGVYKYYFTLSKVNSKNQYVTVWRTWLSHEMEPSKVAYELILYGKY